MKQLLLLSLFCTQIMFPALSQNKKQADSTSSNNNLQAKTANGIVEGVLEKSRVRSFKGIPFAAPPVGDLRWKEPQPVQNWEGVRKADQFGPRATQLRLFGDM